MTRIDPGKAIERGFPRSTSSLPDCDRGNYFFGAALRLRRLAGAFLAGAFLAAFFFAAMGYPFLVGIAQWFKKSRRGMRSL